MKKKGAALRLWRFIKKAILTLFILQLVYMVALKWIYPPITITQLSSWFNGTGLQRNYIENSRMPVNVKLAVIASEDQLFADHNGFDWKSIEKAMAYNKKKPDRIRGASTISQQVAKNVFLWQGKSWIRKGLELYYTFMIELLWGRKRILEMYLNIAETGKGIFGIEAAALYNFKKPAIKLTRREAAMLAACLPNPKRYTVNPLSRYVSARYPWVTRQMYNLERDPDIQKIIKPKSCIPSVKKTK